MIQKNNLNQFIKHNKEYSELITRVEDIITYVLRLNSFKILYFVNENEREIIQACLNHFSNVECKFISKITNSDYYLAVFYHKDITVDFSSLTILYQAKFNPKFNELSHRDILGALMSLNIERHLIGDIVVKDNHLYFEVVSSLQKYLEENLTMIRRIKLNLKEAKKKVIKDQEYQEGQGIVKSLRLDNIVKLITKKSSKDTKEYILSQQVKLNQVIITNFSKQCQDNDILSLKGYGRYKLIINENKVTKKGNYSIKYLKYV